MIRHDVTSNCSQLMWNNYKHRLKYIPWVYFGPSTLGISNFFTFQFPYTFKDQQQNNCTNQLKLQTKALPKCCVIILIMTPHSLHSQHSPSHQFPKQLTLAEKKRKNPAAKKIIMAVGRILLGSFFSIISSRMAFIRVLLRTACDTFEVLHFESAFSKWNQVRNHFGAPSHVSYCTFICF